MKPFSSKQCRSCDVVFQPKGPASLYCKICAPIKAKESRKLAERKSNLKKGKQVGIGSGNANKRGKEDSQYKNGLTFFHKIRKALKAQRRYCERCSKDLINATRGLWCTHHKDHNRSNNVLENYELLCKRCHQLEHKCWKQLNIKGATTISKESKEQGS